MKIDLHVHTKHSIDSLIEPKGLAARSGLCGVIPAITDHDGIGAHPEFRAMKAAFIPGEEIRTDSGDLIGLFISEAIGRKTPFMEAVDRIHSQGGLAYLPHMFDRSRHGTVPAGEGARKLDIIEAFNARCPLDSFNKKAASFALEHGLPAAAGSDSHFLFEFGSTFNEVPDFDLDSPRALLKALRSPEARLVSKKATLLVRGTTTFVAIGRKLLRGQAFRRPL